MKFQYYPANHLSGFKKFPAARQTASCRVAPSHVLSELTGALDTTTRAKLRGTLAKDLVKTPDHELWPHLKEWVRPVHRAGVPAT